MVANGYTNLETSEFVSFNELAILRTWVAVYRECTALDRECGVLIVHGTAYREAADILETDVIVCKAVAAHIACVEAWVELMCAQYRAYKVCCSVTAEWYTADSVVTVHVGYAINRKLVLIRYNLRNKCISFECGMVAVGHTLGLAVVIYTLKTLYALVQWPVAQQA